MKRLSSLALAAFTLMFITSWIASTTQTSAQSSAALSIEPTKEYLVEKNETIEDELSIRNLDSTAPLELSLRVIDFTYTDDGGTPKLLLDPEEPQTSWSLKPFLNIPKQVTIPPKQSKSIPLSLGFPPEYSAGSYYSAIVYSSSSGQGGDGNVGLNASGVTLVFSNIPGKVKEDLALQKFGAYHAARDGQEADYTFITTRQPEQMAYTLKNNGNVVESPAGSITLAGLFGQEKIITEINPTGSLALIGQTRTFTTCIELAEEKEDRANSARIINQCQNPSLWPGPYKATLEAFYGYNGNPTQTVVSTATFWYLPWWFITALVIAILAITYVIWRIKQKVQNFMNRPKYSKKRPRRR